MLFLLPPSESKLDGGSGTSGLDLGTLSFPELGAVRHDVVDRLLRLSLDRDASVQALGLGPRLAGEVDRNRALRSSPTMPALSRYTGVLFDPVRAGELDPEGWAWAHRHVVIHSALFGLLRAADLVPGYRLSHDSKLPGARLGTTWSPAVSQVLDDAAAAGEFIVDLRSEGYVGLGPAPRGRSSFVRVVSDVGGRRRALNHFNKKSKGLLVHRLLRDRPELDGPGDLTAWAAAQGIVLEESTPGEMVLVAESLLEAAPHPTGTGPTR